MSHLKSLLRAGATATLINADHPSSSLVAALGGIGIDAVMIDCEQGAPSFGDIEDMTRAAHAAGIDALVRVPSVEPWTIERYVLRRPDGLVIPRLDSGAQAARAVDDIRYCLPAGLGAFAVIVQVESAQAVDDLDAFLAIDEIDCLFIGAVDLAKSMGFAGDYTRPEVQAAIDATIGRIRDAGRSAGMLVTEATVRHWHDRGATLLYGHVNDFVRIGAREWRRTAGLDAAGEPRGRS